MRVRKREDAVGNRNITLSLSEEDLTHARIMAARRGISVSRLLAMTLREMVERDTGYTAAKERSLAMMSGAPDLGTGGQVSWSRDELHER